MPRENRRRIVTEISLARRAIEQFGIAHTLEQVRSTLEDLAYVNRTNRHWLRTGLNIRISGRRLYALAERLARAG